MLVLVYAVGIGTENACCVQGATALRKTFRDRGREQWNRADSRNALHPSAIDVNRTTAGAPQMLDRLLLADLRLMRLRTADVARPGLVAHVEGFAEPATTAPHSSQLQTLSATAAFEEIAPHRTLKESDRGWLKTGRHEGFASANTAAESGRWFAEGGP